MIQVVGGGAVEFEHEPFWDEHARGGPAWRTRSRSKAEIRQGVPRVYLQGRWRILVGDYEDGDVVRLRVHP